MNEIARSEAQSILDYDPETGALIWRHRPVSMFSCLREAAKWNSRWAGKLAGTINVRGYIHISYRGHTWKAHRLAYLIATGDLPTMVDHIDGVKTNNALSNLRAADRAQNKRNSFQVKGRKYKGVYQRSNGSIYAAIRVSGKTMNLGTHPSFDRAASAYDDAAVLHFGNFAKTNVTIGNI